MHKQENELLGSIHQNAKMGTDTIAYMVKVTNDIAFRRVLESQQKEYQRIVDEAQLLGQERGFAVAKVPDFAASASNSVLRLGLAKDDSVQNMAKMLVKGSTNGVIEITRHKKEYADVDEPVASLAERLLQTEQANIDQMKRYL